MSKVDTYTDFMVAIANDNSHGYSQIHRSGNPDYDCSSLVADALQKAGFNVNVNSTTRNLYEQLKRCGFTSCNRPFKKGDIHLAVGHHVCVSTDSEHIVHASIDENGTTKGRKSGDQTGKEICIRKYYTPSYGWSYHLRYNGDKGSAGYNMNLLKRGSSCADVTVFEILMAKLGYYTGSIDTKYGAGCVRACENFQTNYGLSVDGECGKNTWNKLFRLGIR
nr:MAG TPA: N acetylmuramidase [Caudoviricetes sp.]